MDKAGHFIVVEGLEGAGKSTALHTIKRFLYHQGMELLMTREPGGTAVAELIRGLIKNTPADEMLDPRAELLLLYAARVQLLEQVIRPALARGCWVIGDRFELSTFAYQGGGRNLDQKMIANLSSFCLNNFKPNLIIFLDIAAQKGLQRARKRGKMDRIEQETVCFFNRVYESYQTHIKTMENVVVIDANQPLMVVQRLICSTLETYLNQNALFATD